MSFYSIDREDIKPPSRDYVRSFVKVGCWKIESHPGEDGTPNQRSFVRYFCEFDLSGYIPQIVLSHGAKTQAGVIPKLRELIKNA